jgi:hypothetical protein
MERSIPEQASLAASDVSFFRVSGTGLYSRATMFASGGELVPAPVDPLLPVSGPEIDDF